MIGERQPRHADALLPVIRVDGDGEVLVELLPFRRLGGRPR